MSSSDPQSSAQQDVLLTAVGQCGDRAAFAHLFRFYAPRLKGWLVREGCEEAQAEELAQDTMLTVWRKAALFDPARGSASAWIFTIARNLRTDAVRQERHPSELMPDLLMEAEPPVQADTQMAADQNVLRVQAALEELPPEQADVVRHVFFSELAHNKIESRLNIPLGTVKSRLRLAIGKLRTSLRDLR